MSLFFSFHFTFVEGEEGNIVLYKAVISNYIGQSIVVLNW